MADTRTALEILDDLTRLSQDMFRNAPPSSPSQKELAHLSAVVAKLSQPKKTRPVKCPPDYVALWNGVALENPAQLPNRAIRFLSWETDIAIQPTFQQIALSPQRVSPRSLQGIMRSVHRRWNRTKNTESVTRLSVALTEYSGGNSLLQKWRNNLQHVLKADSPVVIAKEVLRDQTSWESVADRWGFEANTDFGEAVLEACVAQSLRPAADSAELKSAVIHNILPSRNWTHSGFRHAVTQLLLGSSTPDALQEKLKQALIEDPRLLDPRVPANAPNWAGVSQEAQNLLIQWLSAYDIKLFFDHVLPTRSDPHGRKTFWLRYTKRVNRSRTLLSQTDELRWRAGAETRRNFNYGRVHVNSDTSAFLLDFGRILVVEFSKVGNAVYIYEHRDVPDLNLDFWSSARFSMSSLKQRASCVAKIVHNKKWQGEMRTLLAQYGIHPGG